MRKSDYADKPTQAKKVMIQKCETRRDAFLVRFLTKFVKLRVTKKNVARKCPEKIGETAIYPRLHATRRGGNGTTRGNTDFLTSVILLYRYTYCVPILPEANDFLMLCAPVSTITVASSAFVRKYELTPETRFSSNLPKIMNRTYRKSQQRQ